VDSIEFDFAFTCDCSATRFKGDNCEVDPLASSGPLLHIITLALKGNLSEMTAGEREALTKEIADKVRASIPGATITVEFTDTTHVTRRRASHATFEAVVTITLPPGMKFSKASEKLAKTPIGEISYAVNGTKFQQAAPVTGDQGGSGTNLRQQGTGTQSNQQITAGDGGVGAGGNGGGVRNDTSAGIHGYDGGSDGHGGGGSSSSTAMVAVIVCICAVLLVAGLAALMYRLRPKRDAAGEHGTVHLSTTTNVMFDVETQADGSTAITSQGTVYVVPPAALPGDDVVSLESRPIRIISGGHQARRSRSGAAMIVKASVDIGSGNPTIHEDATNFRIPFVHELVEHSKSAGGHQAHRSRSGAAMIVKASVDIGSGNSTIHDDTTNFRIPFESEL
jgi:hypothetical protein